MSAEEIQLNQTCLSLRDMEDKENSMPKELHHRSSPILFTDDQGRGLRFALRPCPERKIIRELIEKGGGYLVSKKFSNDCINLVSAKQMKSEVRSTEYLLHWMVYVLDCDSNNELLELDLYRVRYMPEGNPIVAEQEETNEDTEIEEEEGDGTEVEDEVERPSEPINDDDDTDQELQIDLSYQSGDEKVSKLDETVSRYFKSKNTTPEQSNQFHAYFKFLSEREPADTPENLRRIKEAFKDLKKKKNDETNKKTESDSSQYALRSKKRFGEKIAEKMAQESEESSDESGHKVSDISSDETHSQTVTPKKKRFVNKRRLTPSKALPKQTKLYSLDEDVAILDFIIASGRLDELKGNALWKDAENNDTLPQRSWQSMKERFRKYIIGNIDTFDINKEHKEKIKKYYFEESYSKPKEIRQQINTTFSKTRVYTTEEDMEILNRVIRRNGFDLVKGNSFWYDMEADLKKKKKCDRTWQSLKERYNKRIVPNLYNYDVKKEMAEKILLSAPGMTDTTKAAILRKINKKLTNQLKN